MRESLKDWCKINLLQIIQKEKFVFSFEGTDDLFLELSEKERMIDKNMHLVLDTEEKRILEEVEGISFVAFEFGGAWYTTKYIPEKYFDSGIIEVEFDEMKYHGVYKNYEKEKHFAFLGVHSEYELYNGSGLSKNWAKKAKFYGHSALGISDKNTLAGTIAHQTACNDNGIKSILGETVTVAYDYLNDGTPVTYDLKLYVKDKEGWKNLLGINKIINVDNGEKFRFVDEKALFQRAKGLIAVIPKLSRVNLVSSVKEAKKMVQKYRESFEQVYYQIDSVNYFDESSYQTYAKALHRYLNYFSSYVEPILISDAYYIDPEGAISRKYLNDIGGMKHSACDTQYYKNVAEQKRDLKLIYKVDQKKAFENNLTFREMIKLAVINTTELAESCNFQIDIGNHKLPQFEYDGDNNKLFEDLLEEGLKKKVKRDKKKRSKIRQYRKALSFEKRIIMGANFVDFFLIHWDFVKKTKDKGKLVGVARGSVGGCLISYLLDITEIDPLEYDLLFERFLNPTRVSKERAKSADAMPDIDIDFGGSYRHEVKHYLEEKYGEDFVVSVGTYNRIKLKSALKGFMKSDGYSFGYSNMISKQIRHRLEFTWGNLFEDAQTSGMLKEFIQKSPQAVNAMRAVMNQAAVSSIHASATIIVPKVDSEGNEMNVFDWMPVRKVWEEKNKKWVLVSEWEGKYVERAGFLKEDILGLSQLDKFLFMMNEIRNNRNKEIKLLDIPLDDEKVFDIFQRGFNEDVFQFNSLGMKQFCRNVKPDHIEDLIAMNALYRPGPMSSNAHVDYAAIKHGKKKPAYDYGLKEVTKKTYGLYIYQEQIMQAVHILGGLSLSKADEVRTIMKKFDKKKMKLFRDQFIEGAMERGCKKIKAELIWAKLERFSGYGFNRSHAAAYSIISYWSQWFKAHYPEEFYACALHFCQGGQDSEYEVSSIIDEVESRGINLTLLPPDINQSTYKFTTDIKNHYVYWSLTGIKGIGSSIVNKVLRMREEKPFRNVQDFYERSKEIKEGVGKAVAEKLIIAGAFDQLHGIDQDSLYKRYNLMEHLFVDLDNAIIEFKERYGDRKKDLSTNVSWAYMQKEITGFGKVDYKNILKKLDKNAYKIYLNASEFLEQDDKWKKACIAGKILFIKERDSKRGKFGTVVLESNDKQVTATIWSDVWEEKKEEILDIKKRKKLIAITGKILHDTFRGHNVLYSDKEVTKIYEI
jgi:DNA polymerase III subunit alpha